VKSLGLEVVDVSEHCPLLLRALFTKVVAHGPQNLPSRKRRGCWRALWGDVARRYLRRSFPQLWIYRGGCHIAIHERPPTVEEPSAGHCLARVIETTIKPHSRHA
jgi:hypothetical protein